MNYQLLIRVITGIKAVARIELIVVFAVAAFDLAIVASGIGTNELVADTESGSGCLEQHVFVP